jgi:hypothetical protein
MDRNNSVSEIWRAVFHARMRAGWSVDQAIEQADHAAAEYAKRFPDAPIGNVPEGVSLRRLASESGIGIFPEVNE